MFDLHFIKDSAGKLMGRHFVFNRLVNFKPILICVVPLHCSCHTKYDFSHWQQGLGVWFFIVCFFVGKNGNQNIHIYVVTAIFLLALIYFVGCISRNSASKAVFYVSDLATVQILIR